MDALKDVNKSQQDADGLRNSFLWRVNQWSRKT